MAARLKVPLAILFLTFLAYARVIGFEFVYDDIGVIVENDNLKSWSDVLLNFTQHIWSHSDNGGGTYYRPVFLVWLMLNRTLFGLVAWPWHAAALGLHLICTFGVYLLVRRVTENQTAAAFASLIFGLHPVHTEVVAWVSGATESLMTVFLLSCFLCHLNANESGRPRLYMAASLALYALATLTKETAVVLPVIVFGYWWVSGSTESVTKLQRARLAFDRSAPFLLVTAAYLAVRVAVLGGIGQIHTQLSSVTILLTLPSVMWFYLKHLIYPTGLSAFYDTPYVTDAASDFLLPALFLIIVAAVLLWASRRSPTMKFAAILLVVPLLPVLNIAVFQEGDIAHDRYLYLPSIGFSIMIALGLTRLKFGSPIFGRPASQVIAVVALVFMLTIGTATQNQHWASNLLLYYRGVGIAPNSAVARNNLALEMFKRGLHTEAIAMYRQVLEQRPNFWLSNYNLGFSFLKLGRFDEAEMYFNRSISIDPADADQYYYLGLAQIKMNRPDEAAANMRRAGVKSAYSPPVLGGEAAPSSVRKAQPGW